MILWPSTYQYTIHWKPIITQWRMDEPQFNHNWVINVRVTLVTYPVVVNLFTSSFSYLAKCAIWFGEYYEHFHRHNAPHVLDENDTIYKMAVAEHFGWIYGGWQKSQHSLITLHFCSICGGWQKAQHSTLAQYADVGKSHNTVLPFALDWSDVFDGS
jgi:hypothetical protein